MVEMHFPAPVKLGMVMWLALTNEMWVKEPVYNSLKLPLVIMKQKDGVSLSKGDN